MPYSISISAAVTAAPAEAGAAALRVSGSAATRCCAYLPQVRSFTSIRHRLLPCTEGTDQTDEDSTCSKDDPHFRSRDSTGNGNADGLSGGRTEENGGGHEDWHTVILTGHRGVGKSSIVSSFLRSDKTSMKDSFASDSSPFGNHSFLIIAIVPYLTGGCLRGVHTAYDVVRPYDHVRGRPTSYDVVRPRMYYACRLLHTNNKMATKDDVYDVVSASSSYLYAFGKFSHRRFDKFDLDASGFTTCCVVQMTRVNMPDSYKNFRWAVTASTDTFGCQQSSLTMFWGWWDHTFYVYQLCTWLRMCRDVRRCTSYVTPL